MEIKPTLWKTIISLAGGIIFYILLISGIIKCGINPCFYSSNAQFLNGIELFILIYLIWSIFENIGKQKANINIFKNNKNRFEQTFVIGNIIISLIITLVWLSICYLITKIAGAPYGVFLDLIRFILNFSNILTFIIIFIMWSLFRKNYMKK